MIRPGLALCILLVLSAAAVSQTAPPLAPVVAEQEVGNLPVRLNLVALPGYGPGEVVRVKLFLKNVSDRPLALEVARNIPEYDVVRDAKSRTVWTCSGKKMIVRLSMNELRMLGPGQAWEYLCEWDRADDGGKQAASGDYVVSGSFKVNGKSLRSTARRITLR